MDQHFAVPYAVVEDLYSQVPMVSVHAAAVRAELVLDAVHVVSAVAGVVSLVHAVSTLDPGVHLLNYVVVRDRPPVHAPTVVSRFPIPVCHLDYSPAVSSSQAAAHSMEP